MQIVMNKKSHPFDVEIVAESFVVFAIRNNHISIKNRELLLVSEFTCIITKPIASLFN